jgi:NADP-dependent 3-hydroxy acid dehydrogenase YdfG
MAELKGKVAIVTGASSGIGEATALELARAGADVVLAARRTDRLEKLAATIGRETGAQSLVVPTDVTKRSDVEQLVEKTKERFGRVDILVNNAGIMLLSYLKNDHVDEWERMVDVNIKGVLFGVHAVMPTMLEQGSGHIVNVSSVAGHEIFPSAAVYCATKFAVRAFSEGIEKELSRLGIRVTNISPGAVATELTQHIKDQEVRDTFLKGSKDMVFLDARDIAAAVIYAVSQPEHVNVNEVIVRPVQKRG